jgi:hypothetical protein
MLVFTNYTFHKLSDFTANYTLFGRKPPENPLKTIDSIKKSVYTASRLC